MKRKEKKRFVARHFKTKEVREFEFYSLKQAKFFNPHFMDWREVL